ncbi:hypothetical protein L7F22_048325 [Adiantum nelumboides]|nr:hypothetical protein [Adiantum nelumboides]
MARTKQTARWVGSGKGIPRKAASSQTTGKKKQRVSQNICSLREIRKAQKVTDICIPKVPFRRLVRTISDACRENLKWYSTALDALQDATEDYMIKYFIDSFLLAAHAHRVTIMDKDVHSLSMLRYNLDKVVHPMDFKDKKMRDIFLLPPYRKTQKVTITEVKDEDIHAHGTQSNAKRKQVLECMQKQEEPQSKGNVRSRRRMLKEVARIEEIVSNRLEGICDSALLDYRLEGIDESLSLRMKDVKVLKSTKEDVTDTKIISMLRWIRQVKWKGRQRGAMTQSAQNHQAKMMR